ncbi:c-type cytochrome [Spongiibacter sp. KMU-158]|uniref:Cytochrome c-551 n=1 Tax=Spongiibacter pelagi TaxID=2760804 RepID=A0A927C4X7_9GAMM|nr:c-type cytochrome [Spongiibacter pelagi]MBD2860228.1 c-type cytochrome [Spongiibacter pelagi]
MFKLPKLEWRALIAATAVTTVASVLTACDTEAPLNSVSSPWQSSYESVGRSATPAEIASWDIDVRPDFTGLPAGSGSVEDGESLWMERCASCHGDFADSNKFFSPLVSGNITEADIAAGHVASLNDSTRVRTTLMKVATVSTLWDYINRAMPWNAPKTLSSDEVYSLVAYLLSLAYIVDYDFVLSNENIAEVQALLPNRNGMTQEHGLWKVDGLADVNNTDCMNNCEQAVKVESFIPDFARNAHGNLQQQMRVFDPFQGIDTTQSKGAAPSTSAQVIAEPKAQAANPALDLLNDNGCMGCHQLDSKLVGPAFSDVTEKYIDHPDATAYLARKIREGGSGVWGGFMPPMPQLSQEQAEQIAQWLVNK